MAFTLCIGNVSLITPRLMQSVIRVPLGNSATVRAMVALPFSKGVYYINDSK